MFVYYYAHIVREFADLEPHFVDHPERWLPTHLETPFERGRGTRVTVGVGKAFRVTKALVVSTGKAQRAQERTTVPIDVQAADHVGLFPRLEADLELSPLSRGLCQVTLRGTYRPPLGPAGEVIDRLLLHKVAEAAVKDLVEQIARRLEDLGTGEPVGSSRIQSGRIEDFPSR